MAAVEPTVRRPVALRVLNGVGGALRRVGLPVVRLDEDALQAWLSEWVFGIDGRSAYVEKLGAERLASLAPGSAPSGIVDYGRYD